MIRTTLCLTAVLLPACSSAEIEPRSAEFSEVFELVAEIRVEEPLDPIGEISHASMSLNGEVLGIADGMTRRVFSFDRSGRAQASFGRPGSGPGEFGSITGLAPRPDGGWVVSDARNLRLTYLSADLMSESELPTEQMVGQLDPAPGGFIADVYTGRVGVRLHPLSDDGRIGEGFFKLPSKLSQVPYWGSIAGPEYAVVGSEVVAGNTLLYPFAIRSLSGDSIGVLGEPPPSWRPASEPEVGEFSGLEGQRSMGDYFESFDVIVDLVGAQDQYLVVVHGSLGGLGSTGISRSQRAVDAYDVAARHKLFFDVELPSGARVMSGGPEGLLLLTSEPPAGWTLSLFRLDP